MKAIVLWPPPWSQSSLIGKLAAYAYSVLASPLFLAVTVLAMFGKVLAPKAPRKLAGIAGGNATWIVEAGGYGGKPIAVVAQQWEEPRLLVPNSTTVESLFAHHKTKLFFKYWCQANPDAVFNALATNTPLPNRYA